MDGKLLLSITISLLICSGAKALDEEAAKELKCLKDVPSSPVGLDLNWISTVPKFYFNHASKLDFYRTIADFLRVPYYQIKDEDLYYDSCITLEWKENTEFVAFGKKVDFAFSPVREGVFTFRSPYLEQTVSSHLTLTDNESFAFFYNCWEDGEASWAIISPSPVISKRTLEIVDEHAKALGFKAKNIATLRYETCDKSAQSKVKSEL